MRTCENCKTVSVKRIWHPYKDFRCTNCNAEYKFSSFTGIGAIPHIGIEIFFSLGLILALYYQSWIAFIILSIIVPIANEIVSLKYSKIKLVGFYATLKKAKQSN